MPANYAAQAVATANAHLIRLLMSTPEGEDTAAWCGSILEFMIEHLDQSYPGFAKTIAEHLNDPQLQKAKISLRAPSR